MSHAWQLQDAKNRFSRVVEAALTEGPQIITRRGTRVAVVLAYDEYARTRSARVKLSDFLRSSPLEGLDLARDRSLPRKDLEL